MHAIIIAFGYKANKLSGALIDLFNAYIWFKKYNYNITIITDITTDIDVKVKNYIVNSDEAKRDILFFYEHVKKSSYKCDNVENLCNILRIACKNKDKLVIYYSGHGISENMLLPSSELLPFEKFRDIVLEVTNEFTEILWILDCCNPNGMHLPFRLNSEGFFHMSKSKISFITQPMLLITSAEQKEKSVSDQYGSFFTRYIFQELDNTRNLLSIISNVSKKISEQYTGYSQTVSIYSSYIFTQMFFWINHKTDIVYDISEKVIVIRNNTS